MKALAWIAKGVAALIALVVGVWGISKLLPVPEDQRQARALLEQDPGFSGRNGFAALWFLGFEGVPVERYDELLAQDVAAQRRAQAQQLAALADVAGGQQAPVPFPQDSVAQGQWPRTAASVEPVCTFNQVDCLEKVRAAPQAYAKALEGQQALLDRLAALGAYDYVQSPFPPDVSTPLPWVAGLSRAHTAYALAHVQGRSDEALAGVCRTVLTGRMLMSRSDSLLIAMVGGRMVQSGALLFSQVLAELPANQPLPPACNDAFVLPKAAELSTCNAMRGEFRLINSVWPTLRAEHQPGMWLLLDEDKTIARNALPLAHACTTQVSRALAQDAPIPPAPGKTYSPWSLRCAANAVGCILSSIAGPAYEGYTARLQDAGAQLRLVAIALWLREQPAGSELPALLRQLPEPLRSPSRAVRLSDDGHWLEMPAYADKQPMPPRAAVPSFLVDVAGTR